MRRPMHRPSTIDKLDPDLRFEVDRLRIEEGKTINEIVAFLKTMGEAVSRSSVGRHVHTLEETTALLREKREMAKAIMRDAGADPENRLSELAIELIQGNLVDLAVTAQSEDGGDHEEVLNHARAAAALASARKTNVERSARQRAENLKAAVARVERVAKSMPGMSKETVDAIAHAVLGAD